MKHWSLLIIIMAMLLTGCRREPELHLYDEAEIEGQLPVVDVNIDVYWDYDVEYGIDYDWRAEWFYPWDASDGPVLGYTEPNVFNVRRYYTGGVPYAPHTTKDELRIAGRTFSDRYAFGFWDFLVWNEIRTTDGVQSLVIDETTSLDYVTASTNQTMNSTRYQAPRYTRSFYEPEELFTGYDQAEEIRSDLKDFVFDEERNRWVKTLNMLLRPVTYIYLTQVIIHNNRGRIAGVDGGSNLSGMARTVVLNTGQTGADAITVSYSVRKKDNCDFKPLPSGEKEKVDIIGGRVLSFGISNTDPNSLSRAEDSKDSQDHYMDVKVTFNNGMDSTLVFNVTDQVRKRYKGGVITVELDMDTVPIPRRSGGSGFDAVVKDFEEETHEFEM